MKYIIYIITVIAYFNSYAQSLDQVMKQDTLYVCFDYGKNQKVQIGSKTRSRLGQTKRYYFSFGKKQIYFILRKYLDYDAMDIDKIADIKIVKKRFLRKNKDKILDYNFFEKQKNLRLTYFDLKQKVFYLIDKAEIKRNKIILREVRISSTFYEDL